MSPIMMPDIEAQDQTYPQNKIISTVNKSDPVNDCHSITDCDCSVETGDTMLMSPDSPRTRRFPADNGHQSKKMVLPVVLETMPPAKSTKQPKKRVNDPTATHDGVDEIASDAKPKAKTTKRTKRVNNKSIGGGVDEINYDGTQTQSGTKPPKKTTKAAKKQGTSKLTGGGLEEIVDKNPKDGASKPKTKRKKCQRSSTPGSSSGAATEQNNMSKSSYYDLAKSLCFVASKDFLTPPGTPEAKSVREEIATVKAQSHTSSAKEDTAKEPDCERAECPSVIAPARLVDKNQNTAPQAVVLVRVQPRNDGVTPEPVSSHSEDEDKDSREGRIACIVVINIILLAVYLASRSANSNE